MQHALVLGGGSFGTALAQLLAQCGVRTTLWVRSAHVATAINAHRRNPQALTEFALHTNIWATTDLSAPCKACDTLICALPSSALREVLTVAAPHLGHVRPIIIGTKGIERATLMTMDAVAIDVLGDAWQAYVVALSGPSFAREIMLQHPTAVVLACRDEKLAQAVAQCLFTDFFRPYCSTDVIGVEMGGALKNVVALAAGAIAGLGLGDNTRAALITRGIAEMSRLAQAQGGQPLTLMGLAGVGDLVLTCTGTLSRNRTVGLAIGRGLTVAQACASVGQVVEGVDTTAAAYALAQTLGVEVPIIQAVHRVLFEAVPVRCALAEVMRRTPGREGNV